MTDLVLHGLQFSTYVRTAQSVCEAKGVPYDLRPVDFRSPEYRALHPFGRMPAMTHGDVTLYETLAIASYVDEAFDGPALQPGTPAGRALMLQWISAVSGYLYPALFRGCLRERFVKRMRGLEADEEAIASMRPAIEEGLGVAEAALSERDFLAGDAVTIADFFLMPILAYFAIAPEGQATLPEHPDLSRWMERMAQTPGYGRVNVLPG